MQDGILTINLSRDAHAELEALRHESDWLASSELREVVFDFSQVTVLNSMTVGHLVKLKLALRARSINLRLENLQPSARLVLYHSNLGDLFGITLTPPRWEQETAG